MTAIITVPATKSLTVSLLLRSLQAGWCSKDGPGVIDDTYRPERSIEP